MTVQGRKTVTLAGHVEVKPEAGQKAELTITSSSLVMTANQTRVRLVLGLQRRPGKPLLTIFLPSCLLLLACLLSPLLRPFPLAVHTTLLLLLAIIMVKPEPPANLSGWTLMDVWLVFCRLVPSSQLLLLILRQNWPRRRVVDSGERLYLRIISRPG